MAGLITCAGADVQSGDIHMGLTGAWWAELVIATDQLPSGRATIAAAGGLSLTGTIRSAGAYLLTTKVRLVGGAGGMSLDVVGAFQGAELRDVLAEIMRQSGETQSGDIAADVLAVQLPSWTLGKCSAKRALDQLAAAAAQALGRAIGWRVLPDGSTWMGSEAWPAQAMPDDSVISKNAPAEGRAIIGCSTPFLLPGVNLDGVGQLAGVDHHIEPSQIRSEVWTAAQLDPIDKLAQAVSERLGLAYAGAPAIDRLALYRARVDAAASDGSTVDVTPESQRLSPMAKVKVRHGAAVAAVKPDAEVLIGWEAGDVGRVYARLDCEEGAGFSKAVLAADSVYLGAESGSQFVALANLVGNQLTALKAAISGAAVVANDGGAALKTNILSALTSWPSSTAAAQTKAK